MSLEVGHKLTIGIVIFILVVAVISFADEIFLKFTDPPYLYDDTKTVFFNETHLNSTIDARGAGDSNCSVQDSCPLITYQDTAETINDVWTFTSRAQMTDGLWFIDGDPDVIRFDYTGDNLRVWDSSGADPCIDFASSDLAEKIGICLSTNDANMYLDMNRAGTKHRIVNLGAPINNDDAVTKSYADSLSVSDVWVNESGDTMTGQLNITAFGTGNILQGEFDLIIGQGYGAIEVGDIQIFQSNLTVAGMNLNGSAFMRNNNSGDSPIEFGWATSDNLIRLAIPIAGADYAIYNPRSMMVGGGLGQAFDDGMINCTAQGYNDIDCDTGLTGADLGIQDDLEVNGTMFIYENSTYSENQGIVWRNDTDGSTLGFITINSTGSMVLQVT